MISSHIDGARRLLTTHITGRLSSADLATHLYRVIRDPKFSSDLSGLIVALHPEAVPTPAQFALLRPVLKVWVAQRAGARWAVVVPDADARNVVERFVQELHLGATTRCFLSEPAALAWLQTQRLTAAMPHIT